MTKEFQPTYLCIKTHTITGLKYFCKTTKQNYHGYAGSGKHWVRHLKIHGRTYTTEVLGHYTDKEECRRAACAFSIENNIVGSVDANNKKIWANQIIENGLDGGKTYSGPRPKWVVDKIAAKNRGQKRTPEQCEKYKINSAQARKRVKGEWTQTAESIQKIKIARAKQVITPESRIKIAEKLRGRKRPEVAEKLRGQPKSETAIKNMRLAQQNRGPVSEQTKQKIRIARAGQIFTEETKKKLSGKVVVVGKKGNRSKISKEQYVSQVGPKTDWEWVAHRSTEAKQRLTFVIAT